MKERINNLTPYQRRMLAERIAAMENAPISNTRIGGQLVAYYVADADDDDDAELTESRLRSYCRTNLPSRMVPQSFVQIEQIPRTTTGKIDRKSLKHLSHVARNNDRPSSYFTDNTQRSLHVIWSEVLRTEIISPDANFFEIGGDSLALIKLVARCQESGFSVTPSLVYNNPTIVELAASLSTIEHSNRSAVSELSSTLIRQRASIDDAAGAGDDHYWDRVNEALRVKKSIKPVRLSGYEDKPSLFLIPPKGHYFDNFRFLAAEISEYTCYSPYSPDQAIVQRRTVEDLVPEFLTQIRRQQPVGPYRIAGHCEGAYLAWNIAIELTARGEDVSFLGILDTPNPSGLKPISESALHGIQRRFGAIRTKSVVKLGWQLTIRSMDWILRRARQAITKELHLTRVGTRMAWLYRAPKYSGHVTLFRIVKRNDDAIFDTDITHGWGDVASGGFDICSIPGSRVEAFTDDHFLSPPHAAVLAKRIELVIEASEKIHNGQH